MSSKRFDAWKKTYHFKNKNRGAELHWIAGLAMSYAGKGEQSAKYFKAGLDLKPTDEKLKERLSLAASGRVLIGSGSGFVVAPGGYILTNHHVVKPPGRIKILLPQADEPVPAKVVASDARRDIALLKLEIPSVQLPSLRLAAKKPVELGQEVATLGYPAPLGVLQIKKGSISAVVANESSGVLALDLTVNPGNSGGPLFDAGGNVVGMVFAKSRSSEDIDSEGYALSASDLEGFLQKNCKRYVRQTSLSRKVDWPEIVRRTKSGVVRVLKVL